ncbi:MAG: leucine-rich repeat domain-containing protein [Candidatus Poribacteria bacterium]|nr:leucine-rich repeat domain-containing protein [Candidatus Poribacteria bacterium]
MQFTKTQHIFVYVLVLCATLLLIFPPTASAQTVNIPDANLRAAIAEALGKAPNARITVDEMARLTHLEAHNADISNLTGLEFATKLEEIRCNNNLISDISPLAGLIRLRVIELRTNVIRDLSPITELINLEWLIVTHNLISDLSPIEDLINMRGLAIEDNSVSDLSSIAGLIKLERIWIHENPLGDLSPLGGLISLRGFHSWGTPILNLSTLAKLPKLQVIDICGGEISDLSPLEGLTGLRELYLAGNEISNISPLASLKSLTRLSLKHNEVTDVSPLASLSNLTWIELEDNEILDFSPLDVFPESVAIIRHTNPGFTRNAPKIEGPWLWVIVPTEGMSGSKAAASGKDFLAQISGGTVTEVNIATHGAIEGDAVGDKGWTLGKISRRGGNNINGLINTIALGTGNIDHHVAYGSVNLDSPREQNTRMFVGGSDAVKVWLNGKLVHNNATGRDADDYQENFAVTLKEGTNVLLVAVYEGEGWWSGFFGFDTGTEYAVWTQSPSIPVASSRVADINEDGSVSILDLILVARDLEKIKPINPRTDVNGDGKINILDLTFVAKSMDEAAGAAAPSAFAVDNRVSPALIQAWIARAQIETDGSIAFQQGIANLQRLLVSFIPERTALLANYPNPFNPETWIPYQLATIANVQIFIYSTNGVLVRTLDMGHQPAGLYHKRSRAAYWDGKNEVGESVASGVYFYTLTAGDFTETRKMLIMK